MWRLPVHLPPVLSIILDLILFTQAGQGCSSLQSHFRGAGVDQRLKDPGLSGQAGLLSIWAAGSMRSTVLKDKVWSDWGRYLRLSSGLHTYAQMLMWTCLHLYMQTKTHAHQDTGYIQWNVYICSNQIGKFWWICIFMWPSKISTYSLHRVYVSSHVD